MPTTGRFTQLVVIAALTVAVPAWAPAQSLPYDEMAGRIAAALSVERGERVVLRQNADVMAELAPAARAALERAGATVEVLGAGPVRDFDARLSRTDIYVWLPGASAITTPAERRSLAAWVDAGGIRRELHFHWVEGTLQADGTAATHTPVYDALYLDALRIDYDALARKLNKAAALLESGEVRVTSPAGTDIRFRVGGRPFNMQSGSASRARVAGSRMRIDRHTELPAGILRVAPMEASVSGTMAIASMPLGSQRATGVKLEFARGRVVNASAAQGLDALKQMLAIPGASEFREFCLGLNPKLAPPPGDGTVPYFGYGDGVVRMSLGDNEELGGTVRGGFVRWIFFTDVTVTVNGESLVRNGRLVLP